MWLDLCPLQREWERSIARHFGESGLLEVCVRERIASCCLRGFSLFVFGAITLWVCSEYWHYSYWRERHVKFRRHFSMESILLKIKKDPNMVLYIVRYHLQNLVVFCCVRPGLVIWPANPRPMWKVSLQEVTALQDNQQRPSLLHEEK